MKMKTVLAGALVAGLAAVGSIAPAQATTAAEARAGFAAVYLFSKSRSGFGYGATQASLTGACGAAGGILGPRFVEKFATRTTIRISARFGVQFGARVGATVGSAGGPAGIIIGAALGAA